MTTPLARPDTLRIAQISDVHLKPDGDSHAARFRDVLHLAAKFNPHLIVLSGDLTEDGYLRIQDLQWARQFLDQLNLDLLLIPGNHDVGDRTGQSDNPITPQRLANWKHVFKQDHFIHEQNGWRLIGLNSLLIGSGLDEEQAQLELLTTFLDETHTARKPAAVFMHEPAFLGQPGKAFGNRSDYWPIAASKQTQYMALFSRPCVRLVTSGHVHWYHAQTRHHVSHVWCPSPAFIVIDPQFPQGGQAAGFILHELSPQGPTHTLIQYERSDTPVIHFQPQSTQQGMAP